MPINPSHLHNPAPQHGFTLVEMAIVLLIVGLLLGGLLPTISSQIEQQRRNETRKQMDEIKEALTGFAIINGRLPCPTQATLATGQTNAGVEATTGNTCACKTTSGSDITVADSSVSKVACAATTVTGVLPWATLGVSETDAWGRRFTYRVTTIFADDISAITFGCSPTTAPTQSSFALCSSGNLNVGLTAGSSNVAANVPSVIVSHGANGLGAYTTTGQQIPGATGDESENADNNNTFVSHDFVQNGFDDLVFWISPNTLFNRMVMAGKLP